MPLRRTLAVLLAAKPPGGGEGAPGHSLRAPVTDETFYFVMAGPVRQRQRGQ